MIHALNTLHIKDLNKWIRLDARGNEENINAYFSLDEEHLAYTIQSELGEIDYRIIMMIWMKDWLIYLRNVKIY